jgi:hypothetical protein
VSRFPSLLLLLLLLVVSLQLAASLPSKDTGTTVNCGIPECTCYKKEMKVSCSGVTEVKISGVTEVTEASVSTSGTRRNWTFPTYTNAV